MEKRAFVEVSNEYSAAVAAAYRAGFAGSECNKAAPAPSREIPRNMESLFDATEQLSKKLAEFEARLGSVLTPRCPTKDERGTSESCSTELGERLTELIFRVALLIEAVYSMEERLEL
jgi:hypothetical protein